MLNTETTKNLHIFYTTKCNLKCPHCCIESTEIETINHADVKDFITFFSKLGCKAIHILGGEPFLYFNKIVELVQLIRQVDCIPVITTNGYWAKNYSNAKEKIELLKKNGLSQLIMSCDKYHDIPVKWINNIVSICHDLEILMLIRACIAKEDDNTYLLKHLNTFHMKGARIVFEGILKKGRAKSLESNKLSWRNADDFDGPCSRIMNYTLKSNGDLWSCGTLDCGDQMVNPLFVGNIFMDNEFTLESKIMEKEDDLIIRYLGIYGPLSLLKLYNSETNKHIDLSNQFTSRCEFCEIIFREDIKNEITKLLTDKVKNNHLKLSKLHFIYQNKKSFNQ